MRTIVDLVESVETSRSSILEAITKSADEDAPLKVALEGGERLTLASGGEKAAIYAEVLEEAREARLPLYMEADQDRLVRLHTARVGHILSLEETADGLVLLMTNSHSRHLLRRDNPNFTQFAAILREAEAGDLAIAVTDHQGIIDVRLAPASEKFLGEEAEVAPPDGSHALAENFVPAAALEWERAVQIFTQIAAMDCPVSAVAPPCIPFDYPTDWCWVRAHAMVRFMRQNHGAEPQKIWIRGSLKAATRNDPQCKVFWGWHVAPLVTALHPQTGAAVPVVFDPSIKADGPMLQQEWVAAQGDPQAEVTLTAWEVYNYRRFGGPITDPQFGRVDAGLKSARADLKAQIANDGPPPYAHCPV
ncbi:MAG TPA: protein-glutamine glutaminase family protein [Allosphingosinicella sp.]|uniref:protein-glutamine glutaminase family protein n=1 Tax=Allosphingosinicella sp. TaxID=2823234 RepID=UPI002EDB1EAA